MTEFREGTRERKDRGGKSRGKKLEGKGGRL
jgi:hypothetical protein